ncbi:MAG: hypothetical protein JWN71_2139 [Xanthobacteraceae bacterium]|jgi:hypothetical protein|nr:hypothetical protein [Xanthobacteraceae bacterium]
MVSPSNDALFARVCARLAAPGSLLNDGKVISDERPVG